MTLIWDLPTRVFHWTLAGSVTFCLVSGFTANGDLEWHMRSGKFVLALLLFRLGWGLFGATYARFRQFVGSPASAWRYLARFRTAAASTGHNAAGGWAVLAILGLLVVQVSTGLFATDDILSEGPLIHLVGSETSTMLTGLHQRNAWLVAGIVALHVAALAAHRIWRHEAMLRPMITGDVEVDANRTHWSPLALLIAVGIAAVATYQIVEVL